MNFIYKLENQTYLKEKPQQFLFYLPVSYFSLIRPTRLNDNTSRRRLVKRTLFLSILLEFSNIANSLDKNGTYSPTGNTAGARHDISFCYFSLLFSLSHWILYRSGKIVLTFHFSSNVTVDTSLLLLWNFLTLEICKCTIIENVL